MSSLVVTILANCTNYRVFQASGTDTNSTKMRRKPLVVSILSHDLRLEFKCCFLAQGTKNSGTLNVDTRSRVM